ncbi:MAG: class I SAM-dependent methyltransferase [Candidatus Zixiibacteriota bacterium]
MKRSANRLYNDLAWLWPIWEDVEVYREESELFARLIRKHAKIKVRTLLDVGCGGGKNTFHLKRHFEVTGIDVSKAMLANAKKLNPECTFRPADMRNFELKRQFDSVLINDATAYMTTSRDLLKALKGAYRHLKAGGVMITHPEECRESFKQNETTIWKAKTDDMEVTFIENQFDPNPKDDTYEKTLLYLIRKKGKLRIEHDSHVCGLFKLSTWRESLRKAGFRVSENRLRDAAKNIPVFCCVKPK